MFRDRRPNQRRRYNHKQEERCLGNQIYIAVVNTIPVFVRKISVHTNIHEHDPDRENDRQPEPT